MLHRKIIRPLLQEIYQDDPWKMLVCCILLNLTKRQQVDEVRHALFTKYPTEYEMKEANEDQLANIFYEIDKIKEKEFITIQKNCLNKINDYSLEKFTYAIKNSSSMSIKKRKFSILSVLTSYLLFIFK